MYHDCTHVSSKTKPSLLRLGCSYHSTPQPVIRLCVYFNCFWPCLWVYVCVCVCVYVWAAGVWVYACGLPPFLIIYHACTHFLNVKEEDILKYKHTHRHALTQAQAHKWDPDTIIVLQVAYKWEPREFTCGRWKVHPGEETGLWPSAVCTWLRPGITCGHRTKPDVIGYRRREKGAEGLWANNRIIRLYVSLSIYLCTYKHIPVSLHTHSVGCIHFTHTSRMYTDTIRCYPSPWR